VVDPNTKSIQRGGGQEERIGFALKSEGKTQLAGKQLEQKPIWGHRPPWARVKKSAFWNEEKKGKLRFLSSKRGGKLKDKKRIGRPVARGSFNGGEKIVRKISQLRRGRMVTPNQEHRGNREGSKTTKEKKKGGGECCRRQHALFC